MESLKRQAENNTVHSPDLFKVLMFRPIHERGRKHANLPHVLNFKL